MKRPNLLQIEEPENEAKNTWSLSQLALLRLGFRPFYLLAAIFAAVSIPLWLAGYSGWLHHFPQVGLEWHMHEMLYGFAIAVIIGFLFTAARNWTGMWTPRGWPLAAIASLWLAGRLAMLLAPPAIAAALDLLFIPVAAFPLYVVMHKSGNKRNLPLLGLLGLMFLANAAFHAARLSWLALSPVSAIHASLFLIIVLEVVMAGRVIPGFTSNAIPGSKPITKPLLDKLSLILTFAASLAWLTDLPAALSALLAFGCAIAHGWRLLGWKPWKTLRQPLLWILHLAYGWIAAGFALLGMAELGVGTASTAIHALAIASMSSLILGMMTRTSLGHTGRLLKASRKETLMYLLLQAGALARLCSNLHLPEYRNFILLLATVCWSAAFLLFVAVYAPYLAHARLDGREG